MEYCNCEDCPARRFNVLRAMNKEELQEMSASKQSYTVKKGEALYEEGKKMNGVFCVRKGVGKLTKLGANGNYQIVKLVTEGQVIGQREIISEELNDHSAVAINDMAVCFIPKENVVRALHKNTNFTQEVLRHMVHDVKEANEAAVEMAQKTVKQRLAAAYLYLNFKFGTDDKGFLNLNLSREDVANMIGCSTEGVIRMLSDFKKKGLLMASGKKFKIENESMLERVAEESMYRMA